MTLLVAGGRALLPDGAGRVADLLIEDGRIVRIGAGPAPGARRFDASGLLVLPGIVDLHGDAFERQIQPRHGIEFPMPLALRDTEAQLLANGITTAFHAVTLSWEPGLRGPVAWRAMLDALDAMRPGAACDMRVHMRWELHNLDALEMALADIEAGRVHLVSFNDHTPAILRKIGDPAAAAKYSERAMLSVPEFRALAGRARRPDADVAAATRRVAAAARRHGLPMASHDDDSVAARAAYRGLGARICEFPMAEDVAGAAQAAGDWVVMGAPNVVRGGSHLGWASAAALAERGLCTVLSSDYYYPALMQAAFALARAGALPLSQAWALISASPARAAGLLDRGEIAEGMRADLAVVSPDGGAVVATIAQGRAAYLGKAGAGRFS